MEKDAFLRVVGQTQLFMQNDLPSGSLTEVKIVELGTGEYVLQVTNLYGNEPEPDAFVGYRDEYGIHGSTWESKQEAKAYAETRRWTVVGE